MNTPETEESPTPTQAAPEGNPARKGSPITQASFRRVAPNWALTTKQVLAVRSLRLMRPESRPKTVPEDLSR